MAVIHLRMWYSHQQKFTKAMSSLFRRLWVCKNSGVLKLSYKSIHRNISTCINIVCVGTHHKSKNVFFSLMEALNSLSTYCTFHCTGQQRSPESKLWDCNLRHKPTGSCSPDHSYKIYELINHRAESAAGKSDKNRRAPGQDKTPLLICKE
jgi:hypothetical protein